MFTTPRDRGIFGEAESTDFFEQTRARWWGALPNVINKNWGCGRRGDCHVLRVIDVVIPNQWFSFSIIGFPFSTAAILTQAFSAQAAFFL